VADRPLAELLRAELASMRAYETPEAPAAIRLDANESPWPLPPEARERIARELADLPFHRYPDPRSTALRAAIARYAEAEPDELVIGVGSDEAIALLETAIARPRAGRERACVLYPDPSFSMYGISARARGLDAVRVPLGPRFELDPDAFAAAIREHGPSIVFLPSPNNPTGNAFDPAAIAAVIEAAEGALVVLDEAYVEYASRPLRGFFARHENVAILGTLSKIGLAALRVGWVRVRPWLAHELEKVRLPYNLPLPSQRIAELALGELLPLLRAQAKAVLAERGALTAALRGIRGLEPLETDANFFLVRADDAAGIAAHLHARGIQVRAFPAHPRLAGHLRITVGTPDENAALLAALR
jgi:histidinol-phosphate aminotransferase